MIAPPEPWNWTQRFLGACALSLLFAAVQLNWFGLAPRASSDLLVLGATLALVGSFALRVSALGMAIGLALVFAAIFVDQATAAVGVAALRFLPPPAYWTETLPRVALTWALFPLAAKAIASLLPSWAGGGAIGLALFLLPFVRYGPPQLILSAVLAPAPGRFVVLAVPWVPLCVVVLILASVQLLALGLPRRVPTAILAVLGALTLLPPIGAMAAREAHAATGIVLEPAAGGPLTDVAVFATFERASTPLLFFDGERVLRDRFLIPLHTGITARTELSFLPATTHEAAAGAHVVSIQSGPERRSATYALTPPGGLDIALATDGHVVVRGAPRAALRVFADGAEGGQLLEVTCDDAGVWRSALPLSSQATVLVQSGSAWARLAATR